MHKTIVAIALISVLIGQAAIAASTSNKCPAGTQWDEKSERCVNNGSQDRR